MIGGSPVIRACANKKSGVLRIGGTVELLSKTTNTAFDPDCFLAPTTAGGSGAWDSARDTTG
jgi:hypothetical protein